MGTIFGPIFGPDTGGGGPPKDTTPPTIAIISPTPGVAPGDPGGFSADWETARNTPIVIRVTDAAPGNLYQCIVLKYAGAQDETVVWRRGAFRGSFAARSLVVTSTPLELSVLPDNGWISSDAINDITWDVDAIDADGNLAA